MSHTMKNKRLKSRETKKIKKLLNEEVGLGLYDENNSDVEVDLSKDLYPLAHYVNKREEMVEQMFSIMSGNSLTKMLPPLLKDMNLDELKAECLIHLLGISSKRIISTLEGREIDSSSDSDTNSETSSHQRKKPPLKSISSNRFTIKQDGCSDISNDSNEFDNEKSSDLEMEHKNKKTHITSTNGEPDDSKSFKSKKRKSKIQASEKKKKQLKVQNRVTEDTSESEISSKSTHNDNGDEEVASVQGTHGKTLLEILELEMRAKAIRALLKQGGEHIQKDKDSTNEKEQNSESIKSKDSVSDKSEKVKIERNYRKHSSILNKKEGEKESGLVTIDLTDEAESLKAKEIQNKILEEKTETQECNSENVSSDDNKDKQNSVTTKDSGENSTEESSLHDINSFVPSVPELLICNTHEPSDVHKETSKSSWAERWLQSKDVNKVVSTNKICANIRKRMRNARLAKLNSNLGENSSKAALDVKELEGSVTEYQLLTVTQNLDTSGDEVVNERCESRLEEKNNVIQDSAEKVDVDNSKECETLTVDDHPPSDIEQDEK